MLGIEGPNRRPLVYPAIHCPLPRLTRLAPLSQYSAQLVTPMGLRSGPVLTSLPGLYPIQCRYLPTLATATNYLLLPTKAYTWPPLITSRRVAAPLRVPPHRW